MQAGPVGRTLRILALCALFLLRTAPAPAQGKSQVETEFDVLTSAPAPDDGSADSSKRLGGTSLRPELFYPSLRLNNAAPLVQQVVAGEDVGFDLIEIMACPGGCINGAGNPVATSAGEAVARQKVLVNIDKTSPLRTSQGNPDILRLYDEFYGEPNSELAHHLLHTEYTPFQR